MRTSITIFMVSQTALNACGFFSPQEKAAAVGEGGGARVLEEKLNTMPEVWQIFAKLCNCIYISLSVDVCV